jgi:hypothetical protein
MRRWLAVLLVGCSDYGLNTEKTPVADGRPEIVADPEALALSGLCEAARRDVLLQNVGEGTLRIETIEVSGSGWSLTSTPSLPLSLAPGESTLVGLEGLDGEGELVVLSNDEAESRLVIPLRASANEAPTATISAPYADEVLPEGVDYTLSGTASDAEDDAQDLLAEWSASLDGVLATGAPAKDGSTAYDWAAATRQSGPQSVSLTVTDSCGVSATASVGLCQDGANSYDALSLSSWHYEGSAAWDGSAANLLLTPATQNQVGSAFETSSPVNADNVDIDFYVYVGGGSGADGLSLTALDVSRATGFLGGTGCGIGYGGSADCTAGPALPGWSLEIDTYYNGGVDPTADDHLAFTFDGDVDAYQAWATLPEMEDTGWHYVEVSVVAPRVQVAVDGTVYIDQAIPGFYSFSAYVGFTAGTGGETNEHRIDELTITDYSCD